MRTLVAIGIVCLCLYIGYSFGSANTMSKYEIYIKALQDKCKADEQFLDTLELYDNWVDRFDPDFYYEANQNLDRVETMFKLPCTFD